MDLELLLQRRIDEIVELMDRLRARDPIYGGRTSKYRELKRRLEENEYYLAVIRGEETPDYGVQ